MLRLINIGKNNYRQLGAVFLKNGFVNFVNVSEFKTKKKGKMWWIQ